MSGYHIYLAPRVPNYSYPHNFTKKYFSRQKFNTLSDSDWQDLSIYPIKRGLIIKIHWNRSLFLVSGVIIVHLYMREIWKELNSKLLDFYHKFAFYFTQIYTRPICFGLIFYLGGERRVLEILRFHVFNSVYFKEKPIDCPLEAKNWRGPPPKMKTVVDHPWWTPCFLR